MLFRVNLNLKYAKGDYFRGSYDIDRLQVEKVKEIFHEELNYKLESLKLQSVKDNWNNF